MPPGKSASKLQSQPDETWSALQKRLIDISFNTTEILSNEAAEFVNLKSTASHTCPGYTVVALLAVTAFLICMGASIQTTPGMTMIPNLFTTIIGPPSTGKSNALRIAALEPLASLLEEIEEETGEPLEFLMEKVSPSGLSTFLAKHKKCLILSTEVADVYNNLLKTSDDSRFSVSTLCQLFSGEKITVDFATQTRRTIPPNTPFGIIGGIQMKPAIFLTHLFASQGTGLLDRVMLCAPHCLPPTMTEAENSRQQLQQKPYTTDFKKLIRSIYLAHSNKDADQQMQYTFDKDALDELKNLHQQFHDTLCEAINEGKPTPATKHVELITRIAVAIFVLNNTLESIVKDAPLDFPTVVPASAVKKAAKYVSHWEGQKETIVQVLHEITKPSMDQPKPQPTVQDIMAAILICAGPVVTYRSFARYCKHVMRHIGSNEFWNALDELRQFELGNLIELKVKHARPTKVYIKPSPGNDCYNQLVEAKIDVTPAQYEHRYNEPAPLVITKQMQETLIKEKHVHPNAFQKEK